MLAVSHQKILDQEGVLVGVFIPATIWNMIRIQVVPILEKASQPIEKPHNEPMHDWDQLCKYWDFRYPLSMAVECGRCGQKTDDWQSDEPRKFRLKAANLGGLASFECCQCHARINKKHFKDKVTVETQSDCGCEIKS
ncbi:MAG: hypothetical protein EOM25_06935 [Deltaproteobacteria bacterium]|nr:hypothetical protein [Deltaproteobacteria bacterium]